MDEAPTDIPTIRTAVYDKLEFAVENVGRTAGLGIAKGPAGIGKTFALRRLAAAAARDPDLQIVLIRSRPEIEGKVRDFLNEILHSFGTRQAHMNDASQAVEYALMTYPPARTVLIVDEAQGLKINILEMLRGLWDLGDALRLGDPYAPAFGLLLVGNEEFLSRSGGVRKASFEPLLSRVSFPLPKLERPSRAECLELSIALCGGAVEPARIMADYGSSRGNLRAVEKVFGQARFLSGGRSPDVSAVRDAVAMMGGF